jgi:hypothetical protein
MHAEEDAVLPESSDASVSIGERVNELDLVVDGCGLEQWVCLRASVTDEVEEFLNEAMNLRCWRSDMCDA